MAGSGSRRAGPSRICAPRITLRPRGRAGWDGASGDAELGDGALGLDALGVGALGVDASDDGTLDSARFGIPPATTSDRASACCGLPNTHSYAASLIPYIFCSAGLGAGDAAGRLWASDHDCAGADARPGAAANVRWPGASRVLAASSFGLRASITDSASRPRRAERAAWRAAIRSSLATGPGAVAPTVV